MSTLFVEQKFKVGDRVRGTWSGNDYGKVTAVHVQITYDVEDSNGHTESLQQTALELAPKLTPEEAWAQLPILILREIMARKQSYGHHTSAIFDDQHTAIRHEAYKLLGGASPRVDITWDVKDQVRKKIVEIAGILDVHVYG